MQATNLFDVVAILFVVLCLSYMLGGTEGGR
jgi:hypothetical protein